MTTPDLHGPFHLAPPKPPFHKIGLVELRTRGGGEVYISPSSIDAIQTITGHQETYSEINVAGRVYTVSAYGSELSNLLGKS